MYTTQVRGHVNAPRATVYQALVYAEAIAAWRVPHGMRCVVHEFDARPGGKFRISLHNDAPDATGKSEWRWRRWPPLWSLAALVECSS
jgi:uncharacterized protein YndB with AHSA1/START domain